MFIFGCPVGLRDILHIAKDQFKRFKLKTFENRSHTKIYFIYFSCDKDFSLLKLSLASLEKYVPKDLVAGINIVVDKKAPFTELQKESLENIAKNNRVKFLDIGIIDWASLDTLKTELSAFGITANNLNPEDFIAKIDSDILFFSPDKICEISKCTYDFIGDGHYSGYSFAQGGMYFIRAKIANKLSYEIDEFELKNITEYVGTMAEDVVIYSLIKKITRKIWLTRAMIFPDELRKVNFNSKWTRQEFAAIHFVHKKELMQQYAKLLRII